MTQFERVTLFLLRIGTGWMFLYAGITKIIDPTWTAAGYLQNAKTFTGLFQWLASSANIGWVNFLNEWGLTLIGASLILGVFVRISSIFGAVLMLLYYFPILDFPYPNPHAFVVDEHIIYALALLALGALRVGRVMGIEKWCANLPICARFPKLRNWIG